MEDRTAKLQHIVAELLDELKTAKIPRGNVATASSKELRAECLVSVVACLKFVAKIEPRDSDLSAPLMCVADALLAVDDGRVSPIFRPPPLGDRNRHPDPLSVHAFRATAAAALQILKSMKVADAAEKIAATLNAAGLKIPRRDKATGDAKRPIRREDVMDWRRTYRKPGTPAGDIFADIVQKHAVPRPASDGQAAAAPAYILNRLRNLAERQVQVNGRSEP